MKKWLVVGIVGAIALGLVFLLGGGVYRTVSGGNGAAYVVNKFTGRTWILMGVVKKEVRETK